MAVCERPWISWASDPISGVSVLLVLCANRKVAKRLVSHSRGIPRIRYVGAIAIPGPSTMSKGIVFCGRMQVRQVYKTVPMFVAALAAYLVRLNAYYQTSNHVRAII